jgi:hypothetical protein
MPGVPWLPGHASGPSLIRAGAAGCTGTPRPRPGPPAVWALDLVPEAGWRAEGLAVGRAHSVPLWPLLSLAAAEPGPGQSDAQQPDPELPLPSLRRRLHACLQPRAGSGWRSGGCNCCQANCRKLLLIG